MNEIYKCAICKCIFTEPTEGYFASKTVSQDRAIFVCLDCAEEDFGDTEGYQEAKCKKNG